MKERIRPFEIDPAETTIAFEVEADENALPVPVEPMRRRQRSWRGWLWGMAAVGATGMILTQAVTSIFAMLAQDTFTGLAFSVFLALVITAAAGLFGREYAAYRRLKVRNDTRLEAERLAYSELHGEAAPLIEQVSARYSEHPEASVALGRYRELAHDSLDDGERVRLFERTVMAPIDRKAHRIVMESSRDIGVLTALSPLGLLDGFLVLWRTLVMIRRLAELYGLRPSATAGFVLLRRSLRNAILAGVADVVTHAAVEHVSAGLMALLSARAGQGAGNALLAARLGLETIRQVRPLAYVELSEPRLSDIRKAILDAPSGKTEKDRTDAF